MNLRTELEDESPARPARLLSLRDRRQDGHAAGVVTGLGRGALWRYLALGANNIEGVLVAIVALRRLGASGYAPFALASVTLGLVATLDLGLSMSVMRSIARDNGNFTPHERKLARADASAAHTTYGACGIGTLLATCLAVWFLPSLTGSTHVGTDQDRLTILLVGVSIAVYLGFAAFDGISAGRRRFAVTGMAVTVGCAANIGFVLVTIGHLHLVALGAGQLVGVVIMRTCQGVWIVQNERWFRILPYLGRQGNLRRVMMFSLPLLVLGIGSQVVTTTDLVVIGALGTAAQVALYRIGTLGPTSLIVAIWTGFDTTFPSLSSVDKARADTQEADVAFLTRVTCYAAGLSLGAMAMLRDDIVTVVLGHQSRLAVTVLVVFCIVWATNCPIHGICILLIARGRQRAFVPYLIGELLLNMLLTVLLVIALGPIGAALATLFTVFVSNTVVMPFAIRNELQISCFRLVWCDGLLAIACGAIMAGLSIAPICSLPPGINRLCIGIAISACVGLGFGYLLLGGSGRETLRTMMRVAHPGASAIDLIPDGNPT